MDELDIEFHHARSRRIFGEELSKERWINDLDDHATCVIQALRDDFIRTIGVANTLLANTAREYVLYGVGRRMNMILYAYESLLDIFHVGREEPLDSDEGRSVTRDLNVIYINIVGVVDNLAWAAFLHRAPDVAANLPATQVGLFTRALARTAGLEPLAAMVEPFRAWFEDLRRRRDPAAHRIPLYLPPALLGPEQAAEYERLQREINEAIARLDSAGADAIMDQQQRLGRLSPVFLHSPSEPCYHFYPTIPEDIGQMIKVLRAATRFLS
jgi:hypothetical protein